MKYLFQAVFLVTTGLVYADFAVAEDLVPAETNFGDPKYNVIDELSAYGGDFRWPVSDEAPRPTRRVIADTQPDPAQMEEVPNINFFDAQFKVGDELSDYGEDYRWPVTDHESDTDGKDIAGVNNSGR